MNFEFINFEFFIVFGPYLHHHAAIAPTSVSVGRTHAVDHDLFGSACCRYDKAAGTHAEAIDAAPLNLRHHAVLGGGQPLSTSLATVVLYLVDEVGGMLQAYTDGESFCFDVDAALCKVAIDVAGRMACSKDDGTVKCGARGMGQGARGYLCFYSHNYSLAPCPLLLAPNNQPCHLRLEVNFATTGKDGLAHVLDDARQAVGADMRMGVGEDGWAGSVLYEDLQDAVGVAALLAARVELAVAVGSCPTLAEAVVALGVNTLLRTDACQVLLALANIFASLYDNRLQSKLDESQGCEQSAWTCPNHNDRWAIADIFIYIRLEVLQRRLLAYVSPYGQVDINRPLTGIDAATQDAHSSRFDSFFLAKISKDALFVVCLPGQDT